MPAAIIIVCLTLVWLNPVAFGPTPALPGLLYAWSSIAMWGVWRSTRSLPDLSEQVPKLVAISWLVAASVTAVMGLLQFYGRAGDFYPWISQAAVGEAYGNLRQRNHYATLLNIGVLALLWFVAQRPPRPELPEMPTGAPMLRNAALGFGTLLLACGNAVSASRTGAIELVCIGLVHAVWQRNFNAQSVLPRPSSGWLVGIALAYLLASAVIAVTPVPALGDAGGIIGRLQEQAQPCQSRLALWSNVIHLIAQKPWAGWGWGELGYANFTTHYPETRFCDLLDNAHNLPLHLAVELGIPLALAMCGIACWLVLRLKPWRETDLSRQLAWSVLVVIGAHSLLEYPLWYGPFQLAAACSIAVLWETRSSKGISGASNQLKLVASPNLWAMLHAGGLVFCAYAAWDYNRISQIYLPQEQRSAQYRNDTVNKLKASALFHRQVRFAELSITPLSPENAGHIHELALEMLHFSPEPAVVAKLIDSAVLMGRNEEADFYRERAREAFAGSKLQD